MAMALRYYQTQAVQEVLNALQDKNGGNPCVEIPTGGGKTPVIATLCKVLTSAGARVLCVAHRKELLEQTAEKLRDWAQGVDFSIVSAGLGSKEYNGRVVIAGVQSVYKSFEKLLEYGRIDFVIIDEAHLIPTTDENADGMYQTLLQGLRKYNPALRVVGLTATPYRLTTGVVCGPDKILSRIAYRVTVAELIGNGFLSPLISKAPPLEVSDLDFHIERGEFKANEVNAAYNVDGVIYDACAEIAKLTKNRRACLLFCCGVEHCKAVAETLQRLTGQEVGVILGETGKQERADLIRRFKGDLKADLLGNKEKPLKYLANVDVLTTGFDAPNVDCVALLRPTASPGLFYQMAGRGFRLCEGKKDCLVLDFAGNLRRFGAIDKLEPPQDKGVKASKSDKNKICPVCFESIPVSARVCPSCHNKLLCNDFICPSCGAGNDVSANYCAACGFKFREFSAHHNGQAEEGVSILSIGGDLALPEITEKVLKVDYFEHNSKKSGKNSLKVEYTTETTTLSEFICFEHEGFPLTKARGWWNERTTIEPLPVSVKQAWEIIKTVGIAEPKTITYRPKKPNEYAPKILNNRPPACKIQREAFPHTDNPLKLQPCAECSCDSYLYENPKRGFYYIYCANCGALCAEISPRTFETSAEIEREVKEIERLGVIFYNPNQGFEEFFNETPAAVSVADDLDDIPF